MIHLNTALREQYGVWSPTGLKATFCLPQAYWADSVDDFKENRSSIQPTAWSPFRSVKQYHKTAMVGIFNCYYQPISQLEEEELEQKAREAINTLIDYIHNSTRLRNTDHEVLEKLEGTVTAIACNGRVYDRNTETSFLVVSPYDLESGTSLAMAGIKYKPAIDIAILEIVETTPTGRRTQRKKKSFLETVISLLPELTPAPA